MALFEVVRRVPDRLFELQALVPTLDADRLVTDCERHGLSAYVGDALAAAQVTLPAAAQQRLLHDARQTVRRATGTKRLLLAALDACAAIDVRPVVLKGYGLASRLYDAPLVRPSTDVDLWVRPAELPAMHEALATLGLTHRPNPALDDELSEHRHLAFAGSAGLVEVHFRLFAALGMASFEDDAVLGRCVEAQLEGRAARYLSPDDEFVYLAVHAANHAFLRASWLVDLQRAARRHALDWPAMAERAQRAGFASAYAAALATLQQTLDVQVPRDAWPRTRAHRLRQAVDARLFAPVHIASAGYAEGRLSSFLVRLWLTDTPRRRLRHLVDGGKRALRRARAAIEKPRSR